jgi:glycosyltransferase involved in cell wall biosynthesis
MHTGAQDRILNFAKNLSTDENSVYLVDRLMNKSVSSFFFDVDNYYIVKNGELKEKTYPIFIRFFVPGFIKLVQMAFLFFLKSIFGLSEGWKFISDVFDLQLLVKLFFVCKKENIDLIQSESPIPTIPSFLVKQILGIPLIFDAHNIEQINIKRMGGNRFLVACLGMLEKLCCRLSDAIFVVSKVDRKILIRLGVSAKKITVIPNSVDINFFSPDVNGEKIKKKYQLQNFTLMFHGALDYPPNREAVNLLVNKIIPSILERYPNTRLLIVGKNPPQFSHPNILFTGFVNDLPQYIAAVDVCIVPLLKGGGTRIKVLEYMACGKPVVSTELGVEGIQLKHGKDVLISQSINSDFVDLICTLFHNKELREKLGNNARKKVEKLYSWEKSAKRALDVYRTLISNVVSLS